jgi:hypothetical protein
MTSNDPHRLFFIALVGVPPNPARVRWFFTHTSAHVKTDSPDFTMRYEACYSGRWFSRDPTRVKDGSIVWARHGPSQKWDAFIDDTKRSGWRPLQMPRGLTGECGQPDPCVSSCVGKGHARKNSQLTVHGRVMWRATILTSMNTNCHSFHSDCAISGIPLMWLCTS